MMRSLFIFLSFLLSTMGLFAEDAPKTYRPLHYLSADKQIYHPGETVYFRDVVLDGQTNYPLSDDLTQSGSFRWQLKGPREEEVTAGMVSYDASVGAITWEIPGDAVGGIYTLRVFTEEGEGAPTERKFEVRNYRAPRIRTQIDFLKRGYLPGEEITAVISFQRAEGEALEKPVVSAMAILDGELIYDVEELPIDGNVATATFTLPKEITDGDGTLNFTVMDGGILEAAGKTIPILLENYSVDFYPEGGYLICGVPNRLYVEARQKNGIGADIQGKIVEKDTQKTVAEFNAIFDGRGIAEIIPQEGKAYQLVVKNDQTLNVRTFDLPAPTPGVTISATKEVYAFSDPIELALRQSPTGAKDAAYATLSKRDTELAKIELKEDQEKFTLNAGEAEGVLIATLFAKDGTPLAERLIFRLPKFRVHTAIEGLDNTYTPGDKVKLTLKTTDDAGTPVAANVGLTITDASVADMIDRRDIAPRLPAMVYLENEVKDFADAGDYFDPEDKLSSTKIDLLLGTQGWRRFVLVRKVEIAELYPDALKRILAPSMVLMPRFHRPRMLFKGARMRNGAVEDDMVMAEEEVFDGVMLMAAGPEPRMMAMDAVEFGAVNGPLPQPAPIPMADAPAEDVMMDVAEAKAVAPFMEAPARVVGGALRAPRRPEIWVREYAHKARQERKPGDRVDFTETIYWSANTQTDPRTGKAEISFELPDTIGAFQVKADAFGNNGALGEYTAELKSVQAFYTEVKLPLFLTTGDQAFLPITLVNSTKEPLVGVNVVVDCGEKLRVVDKPSLGANTLAPGERRVVFARVEAAAPGEATVAVRAIAGGNADAVTRKLSVLSPLFPFTEAAGALISEDSPLLFRLTIPGKVENGSQRVTAQLYTSPAATMEAALNALLQHPHGCFEQTSSTNYPLVMAQQYFLSHSGCDPANVAKAKELLDEGYKKLVSFECSKKGYEWFGADPGHEALSAYGLMEFADMAKVMPVDQTMINETKTWLLNRRDGKGGFLRNEAALDSFGRAPEKTTNAYIVWSLLESGENPDTLRKEIDAVAKMAAESDDDYLKALAANILWLAKDQAGAERFADMLAKDLQQDGTLAHPGPTITCSGNLSQTLECAALAALAWVRCGGKYAAPTQAVMKMLAESCQAGKFGSTQSTVLVLKAINAYDAAFAKPKAPGKAQLYLDGQPFGNPVEFTEKSTGILALPDCGLALTPGEHTLEIRLEGKSELNGSVKVDGMTKQANNAGTLKLETALDRESAQEGEPLQLDVRLINTSPEAGQMPLAVVAIPGGLEPRHEQLQELVKAGRIAAYECINNEVVLYWRGINGNETLSVPIALTAAIPGEYTAAASRAYLYYTDEAKFYQEGTRVSILPAKR